MLFSDIEPAQAESLWPGVIPTGDVSLLIAEGGAGKGMLMADVVARVSRGWPMPPYAPDDPAVDPDTVGTPGKVVMISVEDDSAETTVNRLIAAGADLTMVDDMSHVERAKVAGNTSRTRFAIGGDDGGDLGLLRKRIQELGDVRLVVMDPLMAIATSTVAFNQQMRLKVIDPLQELAKDTGVSIVVVSHFTKGGGKSYAGGTDMSTLANRVAGSKGLVDAVRMASVVVPSPVNPEIRLLLNLKSNMGTNGKPLEYIVVAHGVNDPDAHVEYRMPAPRADDDSARDRLQASILKKLIEANGRPVSMQELVSLTRVSFSLVKQSMARAVKDGRAERVFGGSFVLPLAIEPPQEDSTAIMPAVQAWDVPEPAPECTLRMPDLSGCSDAELDAMYGPSRDLNEVIDTVRRNRSVHV